MHECSICLNKIYVFYHKNKSCKCNFYYHINCINTWYKVSKKKECIICKKKDTTDLDKLEKRFNNVYEFLFQFLTILFIKISFIFLLYIKSN